MKKGLRFLTFSAITSVAITVSICAGITFANYKTAQLVTQLASYQGKFDQTSLFLNAHIWEKDSAIFYMYDNHNNKWHAPAKTITPTINSVTFTLYVFVLEGQINSNTSITFARINPNGSNIPEEGESWDNTKCFSNTPRTVWNQTDNIAYTQLHNDSENYNYNYFVIYGWNDGVGTHNGSEKNDGYHKNQLKLNANKDGLVFRNNGDH